MKCEMMLLQKSSNASLNVVTQEVFPKTVKEGLEDGQVATGKVRELSRPFFLQC